MAIQEPRTADLVLEGGGVKGTALVGALAAFEDAGYGFQRIAGTSSGALVGALAAAGIRAATLHQLLLDTDYTRFLDATFWKRLPIPLVDDALAELIDHALYRGDALGDFIAEQLRARGVHTFADLKLADSGMDPHVAPERRYRLVVVTSDITRQRMVRLPWYVQREYGIAPDTVPVADAVRMSTAIPFFYLPFKLYSQLSGQDSLMVDGGLNAAFPVDIFDRTDGNPPRWPTFFVSLEAAIAPSQRVSEPSSAVDTIRAVLLTGLNGRDNADLDAPMTARRTVFIDTSYVNATNFSIDRSTRERLYEDGYSATQRFLSTFSFTEYCRVWTRPAMSR